MLIISHTSFRDWSYTYNYQSKWWGTRENGVTAKPVKIVPDVLVTIITHLANLSFLQGVFPQDIKIALICPIYKAKDPMIFSNYRTISLLSLFSKILERLMYNRLLEFLNKHNILNKYLIGKFKECTGQRKLCNWHIPWLSKSVRYGEPQNPVG